MYTVLEQYFNMKRGFRVYTMQNILADNLTGDYIR